MTIISKHESITFSGIMQSAKDLNCNLHELEKLKKIFGDKCKRINDLFLQIKNDKL